jgi:hypothetical protein
MTQSTFHLTFARAGIIIFADGGIIKILVSWSPLNVNIGSSKGVTLVSGAREVPTAGQRTTPEAVNTAGPM